MKKYFTDYLSIGRSRTRYGSYVWAKSFDHAEKLMEKRGMGEQLRRWVPSPSRETTFNCTATINMTNPHNPRIMHSLVFVGFVALKSGYTVDQIFGDQGIIHEMTHLVVHSDEYTKDEYADEAEQILRDYWKLCQKLGFLPSDLDLDEWKVKCDNVGSVAL